MTCPQPKTITKAAKPRPTSTWCVSLKSFAVGRQAGMVPSLVLCVIVELLAYQVSASR